VSIFASTSLALVRPRPMSPSAGLASADAYDAGRSGAGDAFVTLSC